MVATVQIEQITGTTPGAFHPRDANAVANKSGTRYMTSDQFDSSLTTYPIPIPTAANGASGSYWTTHCLNKTVAPDTYIKDIKYYQTWTTSPCADWDLSGAGWAGGGIKPGLYIAISSTTVAAAKTLTQGGGEGFPSGQYEQAAGGEGVYGYLISNATNGHDFYLACATPASGGMVSIVNFTSAAPYVVQSGNVNNSPGGGTPSANTTGRSWCIATQVLVGSGATAGNKADKTATWQYTEA